MVFLSKIAKGIGDSFEKNLEDSISKTTGVNVRREVAEYNREIENLERELELLEKEKESFISSYGEREYVSNVRDIRQEINLCKKIKVDILKEILDEHNEEQRQIYRERLEGVSNNRLKKIINNVNAPKLLKDVAREKLNS